MPKWAESKVSKCNSMKDVRDEAKKVDDARAAALTDVQGINAQLSRKIVSSVLNDIVQKCADAGEQLSFPYVSIFGF